MSRQFVSIVGARPQFVKVAPLCRAFAAPAYRDSVEHLIVHTGQHYDAAMSQVFFDELEIPRPAVDLGIGSGSHGAQTGRMLERIEQLLLERRPDLVVVYGDTNSTLAGALAAAKLQIPVTHVEAGLRSFNRVMPEEINRIVADHTADQLLAPTHTAVRNLEAENLAAKSLFSGDIMRDAVLFNVELSRQKSKILDRLSLAERSYGVVTLHRAENTDGPGLLALLETLNLIATDRLPLIFPVHPRTARRLQDEHGEWQANPRLRLIEPLSYLDMMQLLANARIALTDSGGLQKEAFFLDCPCVTLRNETEWLETVQGGGNIVAGVKADDILAAVSHSFDKFGDEVPDFSAAANQEFGAGDAADITAQAICQFVRGNQ